MQLVNGSRVAIVGGGPAGSLSAIHLLAYATQANILLDIQIFEPRDFQRPGPNSCNKCAGVLSSTLVQSLKNLGLEIPDEMIQAELSTYILHLGQIDLPIQKPDANRRIVSVYRGSGPRLGQPPFPASFDAWLLDQACQRGANVQPARVQAIRPGNRPQIVTTGGTSEVDLVVLATGVNSRSPLDPAWGYRPPKIEVMAQDEIVWPYSSNDTSVHIYFDQPPGLVFGCMIPKGRYANISLLGRGLKSGSASSFLKAHNLVESLSAEIPLLCGCTPRVAVSPATKYYSDRLVVVGDAAVSRLYKDGIGAAFVTAQAAASTAVQRGIARQDFAAGYRPTCRQIARDNIYGKILFRLWDFTRHSPNLLAIWQRPILAEVNLPPSEQIYTRILWSMFTGEEPYQKIFRLAFSRTALTRLWKVPPKP